MKPALSHGLVLLFGALAGIAGALSIPDAEPPACQPCPPAIAGPTVDEGDTLVPVAVPVVAPAGGAVAPAAQTP